VVVEFYDTVVELNSGFKFYDRSFLQVAHGHCALLRQQGKCDAETVVKVINICHHALEILGLRKKSSYNYRDDFMDKNL
jgi:hypothetical protein